MITKCEIWAKAIPLEDFRLPSDGRKWRQACRSRRGLFLDLAGRANEDGTFLRTMPNLEVRNYSPSYKKLRLHYGNGTLDYLLNALRELGFLTWTREQNCYGRRIYTILNPKEGQGAQKQFQDSANNSSKIPENSSNIGQKQSQSVEVLTVPTSSTNPSLSIPSNNPSINPAATEGVTNSFSKPSQETDKDLEYASRDFFQSLTSQLGRDSKASREHHKTVNDFIRANKADFEFMEYALVLLLDPDQKHDWNAIDHPAAFVVAKLQDGSMSALVEAAEKNRQKESAAEATRKMLDAEIAIYNQWRSDLATASLSFQTLDDVTAWFEAYPNKTSMANAVSYEIDKAWAEVQSRLERECKPIPFSANGEFQC